MRKLLLPLLLIANIAFGQVDLNLGLRAYYPFSGNANDISGNNNNPVFNNATLTADRFGNPNSAYHFNGIDKYMRIPDHSTLNMGNTMSIALWVKPTGYNTGPCYTNMLVMKSSAATLQSNYHVRFGDIYNGCTSPSTTEERFAGNNAVAQTPFVQLNQWYSVVWTSDGITEKIYVNCVLRESVPAGGIAYSNTFDLLFGLNVNPSFPYWLDGDLDEVRLYNRALNQDEVNVLGGCVTPLTCNNWLRTQAVGQSVTVGDLDISGNQMTIEGNFNCSAFPVSTGNIWEEIVSKHSVTTDCNYALRMNLGAITTTNGFFRTPPFPSASCDSNFLNKTYHAAMVYNGSTLKFYRNGFLMSQIPATGNLILNNLLTTIGDYAFNNPQGTNFQGYLNEIRIWNVARTQSQIQTYMNTSIPNPATQPGLLAYYTFDNLVNKQGNATWNGTLNGGATINNTNPNCTFIADSCVAVVTCNNWLRTQAVGQSVTVGDLDISGNQITVEANFNCSSFPPTRPDKQEDIVSKHANTTDINYVLRMDLAGITTTNGQFLTPLPCDNLVTNKTYHVALVYDGSNLKLYRNGIVISQIAAAGNLILNDWLTTIGDYAVNNPVGTNFLGYINEVRIWNVARTQAQLQTYMNAPLPNPTTQTGLQGYYTFDDLLNKQGNPAWNGTLNGGASINNINPNCTFTPEQGITANAGADTYFCSSGTVSHTLQGSGNGTYSWSPAMYLNNPNIQNPTATVSATTTFYLTVTGSPSVCTGTDSVTIYVNPPPVINTIADTTICRLSPLVLNTTSTATTYLWSPANYVSNPTISDPNFIGSNSQRLYVTGSTGPGCFAMDSVDVFVNPLPVVQTLVDTTLCSAQNIILTTTGAQTYSWSPATGLSNPNIASPVFSGTTTQTYTVTGTGGNGCKNTDIITIDFSSPDSLKQPPSFTICQKQSVLLDGNNGTRMSYLWSPATYLSNATIINPLANPPQTTVFNVLITDNTCGFDSVFTTSLTVLPAPVINAGKSNDIDCANKSSTLFASGGNQYLWSPSTGLNNPSISNPVATPANTQNYTVLVTDAFGCTNTRSITVFADKTASLARYMPNAFTPDGNGINDCYGLKNWMYIQKLQFFIFNRFGEQVFATSNPTVCWNGTYKGQPALAGTYVYVIKAQTNCGEEEQKGSFILIR